MPKTKKKLRKVLCRYVSDTLTNIDTVKTFCEKSSKWIDERKKQIKMMTDIKDRADKMNEGLTAVIKSENKFKGSLKFMKNNIKGIESEKAELEKELAAVVEETLRGLKELDYFLDVVERLVVTSHHVFTENQVMSLPTGINKEDVQVVIITARLICPLLLEFKRDAKTFFKPKLQNIEVLTYQLNRYIKTTETICGQLEKSFSDFKSTMSNETMVQINKDLSEDDVEKMFNHINQLDETRMDSHFRMVVMFQEVPCSHFIDEFKKRRSQMQQCLKDLEDCAVQLDRMNKGSKISRVVGSSVGAVGGIFSIVGLALTPVTAGASLILTMTGMGLGITSGVNSVVTTATKIGVNTTQQKKANEAFKSFMEDVQSLQVHLENVINQPIPDIKTVSMDELLRITTVAGVAKTIYKLNKEIADFKTLSNNTLIVLQGNALPSTGAVASDITDVSELAAEGTIGLTETARVGEIVFSGLFLGIDVFFICKDSISLAKGNETKASKIIRARAALWRSEMNSWQKIHDSLCQGLKTSEEHKAVLEKPF